MSQLVKYTNKELDLLARLMRAEAVGEGEYGMLMVGNVGVNRVLANCYTFKNINTVTKMVYQSPGGFSGINSPQFTAGATIKEKELAKRCLDGEYYYPATNALWFYAPLKGNSCISTWYNQSLAGKYKNHCFYLPDPSICPPLH